MIFGVGKAKSRFKKWNKNLLISAKCIYGVFKFKYTYNKLCMLSGEKADFGWNPQGHWWVFPRPTYTEVLQVESVVLLFADEADTVSEELSEWRAAVVEYERQFHDWKEIWVGVLTQPRRIPNPHPNWTVLSVEWK